MSRMPWWKEVECFGCRILARKGSVNLVKYDNGLYAVEWRTKGCGYTMKNSLNKQEMIECFNEEIKNVRRSKYDINLEVYARE